MGKKNKLNWRKYSFEFLSIFIAVISAFALNNWNENRKNHNAENKILTEIYNGLEKDLEDLNHNAMGHRSGIKAVGYFRALLADKPVSGDSLLPHFRNLTRDYISIQNRSGYETLKSRGLELIGNDSLRTKIISIYEYDYNTIRKLEEEYHEMQYQQNYFKDINESLAPHYIYDQNKMIIGIHTPVDMEVNKEKELLMYLWKIEVNRIFILKIYQDTAKKIQQTRADIKREMDLD